MTPFQYGISDLLVLMGATSGGGSIYACLDSIARPLGPNESELKYIFCALFLSGIVALVTEVSYYWIKK